MAKKSNPLPSQEVLNKLLRYDKETGILYWNVRPLEFFTAQGHSPDHSRAKWNARWANKPALTKVNKGYQCGRLMYQAVLAHRVIWKMVTGNEPNIIDHIDGESMNNAWGNLRSVDEATNRRNTAVRSDNACGATGVFWNPSDKKWVARVQIGSFATREEAIEARKNANRLLGFHENHGRVAV